MQHTSSLANRLKALLAGLLLGCPLGAWAATQPGSAAEILSLQGLADQHPAGSPEWHPAHRAQALAVGDFVRTREAANMALLFSDDTQLRLSQNTVLQVKSVASATQPVTTLMLNAGRLWAQTKRADGSRLNLETPAAVAAIRGTDWDLEVGNDGRTLLTVLSGRVTLSNALGEISVGTNEAALAEVGKAPVRMLLSQPRDRVQWVNALRADPLPHLNTQPVPAPLQAAHAVLVSGDVQQARKYLEAARLNAPASWYSVLEAAVRLREGDLSGSRAQLALLCATDAQAPAAAALMLSDLQLMDGEGSAAIVTLQTALTRWPAQPALLAQLAHAQLLSDQLDASAQTLAQGTGISHPALALVRAQLAHRRGETAATLAAYTQATQLAPQDSRGWFGLGSAYNEIEDTTLARIHLQRALALQAPNQGPQGELGTLETQVNRFEAADAAFAAALADNPADYIAWSGLGLLRLKQGQPDAALAALLRAGVMEPRWARAKTWTAVAYYQLGRAQDAISTLQQAITLDDKDPMPHLLLAQIYGDRFQAGEAVQAARNAVQRLPYLKSLNQLANDQKGSANLGSSLAFFGMEDWAMELAQQSFNPYWGGSHLFLADRYRGEFNKNSALFQGFLTDPLAFGSSQREATLLQKPGSHGALGITLDREFYRMSAPSLTLNGMNNEKAPVAWFFKAQEASARAFPIEVGVLNLPAMRDGTGTFDARAHVLTLGLGLQPNEQLKLFAYFNQFDVALRGNNHDDYSLGLGLDVHSTQADHSQKQGVVGLSYRWSPAAQTWLKLGRSLESNLYQDYPILFVQGAMAGLARASMSPRKEFSDFQVRHSFDPQPGTRWSLTLEHVTENQSSESVATGLMAGSDGNGQARSGIFLSGGVNAIDRHYSALTLATQRPLQPRVTLDASLAVQQIRNLVNGRNVSASSFSSTVVDKTAARNTLDRVFSPRLGLVFKPTSASTVRLAYQDWLRPLSTSTLSSVDTAGIAVEDRLVEAGGRQKRLAAQLGLELGSQTFFNARLDDLQINNPGTLGVDLRTPSLPFLEEMRNSQLANLSATDVLEDNPGFETATLRRLALGVNHMLSTQWSVHANYLYQHGRSDYSDPDQPGGMASGKMIPYIPAHTAVVGTTWASSQRLYLSAQAVYRSERFEEKENLTLRPSGWGLDLMGFWETHDKHWVLGAAALNVLAASSPRTTARYVLDVRYRF